MPPSSLPPEEQGKVKPFDPLVLDRTVIAIPLLKEMEEDFDLIDQVKALDPEALTMFNAAIEFNPAFPGGLAAARADAIALLEQAAEKAAKAARDKAARASDATRTDDVRRAEALEDAIAEQTVGELLGTSAATVSRGCTPR